MKNEIKKNVTVFLNLFYDNKKKPYQKCRYKKNLEIKVDYQKMKYQENPQMQEDFQRK